MIGFKTIEDFNLEECESYLKRIDISGEDRKRAEKRKEYVIRTFSPLEAQTEKDILKDYPEYRFVPLSSKRITLPFWFWCPVVFPIWLAVIFLVGAVVAGEDVNYIFAWKHVIGDILSWVVLLGITIMIIVLIYKEKKKKAKNYYVEEKRGKVLRITDSKKFGLYNIRSSKIIVPVEYDEMRCVVNDQFFEAEKNGKYGLFSCFTGKNVVPVEYDIIKWNEYNQLFEAERNGHCFRFDIYGNKLG